MKIFTRWFLCFLCLLILGGVAHAQPLLNILGDSLVITNGGLMHVNGGVTYNTGYVLQNGDMEITGDWTNTSASGNLVFDDNSQGFVRLVGGSQTIYGSTTRFPNLSIDGSFSKILDVNTEVTHILDLQSSELDVNGYDMLIRDNNPFAITRISGDVKTNNSSQGRLLRTVSAGNTYLFPMGGGLPYRYRPVTATPDADGVLEVQFQNYDPNTDHYDRRYTYGEFSDVNEYFYHTIGWTTGTGGADVSIAYSSIDEGNFNALAEWNHKNAWELANNYNKVSLAGEGTDNIMQWKLGADNITHVLGLARVSESVVVTAVTAFTANHDGKNDAFVIFGLENFRSYELKIFDRWGNNIWDAPNYKNDWKGDGHDIGTYMWVLFATDFNSKKHVFKGDFTLMR